jgi:hypothetical protein
MYCNILSKNAYKVSRALEWASLKEQHENLHMIANQNHMVGCVELNGVEAWFQTGIGVARVGMTRLDTSSSPSSHT